MTRGNQQLARFLLWLADGIVLGIMAWWSFTPWVWERAGGPSESYPELLYLGVGLPWAIMAFVAAGVALGLDLGRRRRRFRLGLELFCGGVLLILSPLVAAPLLPSGVAVPEAAILLSANSFFLIPVGLLALLVLIWRAWRAQ